MQSVQHSITLRGHRVSFTGRSLAFTRLKAAELVHHHAGHYCRNIDDRTTLLVIGAVGWPLQKNGRLTKKLDDAFRLQRQGYGIEIQTEADFLERLGNRDNHSRRFTLPQLSRLLSISPQQLLAWSRIGLLRPRHLDRGIQWYDFHEVTRCRKLAELSRSSISIWRFRKALKQLRRFDAESGNFLDNLVPYGSHLAIRSANGDLFLPSGQQLFDFEKEDPVTLPGSFASQLDIDFERAVTCELRKQYAEAETIYRQILLQNPADCDVLFNLANVLAEQEKYRDAAAAYRDAIAIDSSFLEAWNNLGNVQLELGDFKSATLSFQTALTISRSDTAALYGMARSLEGCGKFHQARQYWQAFLKMESEGDCAEYAHRRLQADFNKPI